MTAPARAGVRRHRSTLDALLAVLGGALVGLPLTGLALSSTGVRLDAGSWARTLGGIAVLGLAVLARDRPGPPAVRPLLATLPWLALAAGVAAVAVSASARTTERAEVAPVAVALQSLEGPLARVLVLSDEPVGPFELRIDPGEGGTLSYPLFTVEPGRPVTSEVVVPVDGRVVITLNRPGSTRPLRSLTLSR